MATQLDQLFAYMRRQVTTHISTRNNTYRYIKTNTKKKSRYKYKRPKTKYTRPKTKHKRPRPRPTKQTKVSTKNWYFNAYVTVLREHSEGTFATADFVLHFLSNKRTEAIFDNFSLY